MDKRIFYIKGIGFWVIFLVLYFIYKFLPCNGLKLVCAVTESNFQHYKAAFFSWIICSLIEFTMTRKKIVNTGTFFWSRTGTATLLPWIVFVMWYIGPAIYGKMPTIPLEIIYANIITLTVGIIGAIIEQGLAGINYFRELKAVILLLFVASLILYIVFTFFRLPWADVFTVPDWR